MATVKEDIVLKFVTTKDGDPEDSQFSAGDEVAVMQEWDNYYLIRDDDGHYYNIPKDKLET